MARAFVSGVGWVEKQTKTVDIDTNGTHEIIPDKGHLIDKVIVNNNVPHYDDGFEDGFEDGKQAAEDAIEPLLDKIISIQNELLGVITFTVEGTEYTAIEGMTWREWCDSEYHMPGFWCDSMLNSVLGTKNGLSNYVKFDNNNVRPDDTIVAGRAYVLG